MDALTDHYADLLIQTRAAQIGEDTTPEAFARAVWLFARAVSAERARLIAEDLQRIPTAAPAANPGERTSPAPGSPQTSGAVVGEVDEELAPFMEATKELRGARTSLRLFCFAHTDDDRRCPELAVELIDGNPFCRACAWHELACIAQMESIKAARAAAFSGSTKEDKHAAAERGKDRALPEPREPERAAQERAESGDRHGDVPGRSAGGAKSGPLRAEPDRDVLRPGHGVQRDAAAGLLELAPVRAGPAEVAPSDRGPAARKDASRDGIAPAAPEVGAQLKVEVAGHAAESVAREEAPSVQPVQEVHHEALIEKSGEIAKGEVAAAAGAAAPRSGKRGQKKKAAAPVSCRTEEQPKDKQVPLVAHEPPRWGRAPDAGAAWHLLCCDTVAEANCGETIDSEVVWLQPGEVRDPEETCLDCAADEERHVPVVVETGDPGVTAIAHVAPNMDATSKAALEDIAKAAAKMMRESIPRATKKKASRATGVRCGGAPGCYVKDGTEHHNPATCPRFKPRDPVTPKPEGIKRAGELAAKYEGSAT